MATVIITVTDLAGFLARAEDERRENPQLALGMEQALPCSIPV